MSMNHDARSYGKGAEVPTIDPLFHALTYIFLPNRCGNTTCKERFTALTADITTEERENAEQWVQAVKSDVDLIKYVNSAYPERALDVIVSMAMERWAERALVGRLGDLVNNDHSREFWYQTDENCQYRNAAPPRIPKLMESSMHTQVHIAQPVPGYAPLNYKLQKPKSTPTWTPWNPVFLPQDPRNFSYQGQPPEPPLGQFSFLPSGGIDTYGQMSQNQYYQPPSTTSRGKQRIGDSGYFAGAGIVNLGRAYPDGASGGQSMRYPHKARSAGFGGFGGFSRRPPDAREFPKLSSPVVPNPSGRTTPPHKREDHKNKNRSGSSWRKEGLEFPGKAEWGVGTAHPPDTTWGPLSLAKSQGSQVSSALVEGSVALEMAGASEGQGGRASCDVQNPVLVKSWSSVVRGDQESEAAREVQGNPLVPPETGGTPGQTQARQTEPVIRTRLSALAKPFEPAAVSQAAPEHFGLYQTNINRGGWAAKATLPPPIGIPEFMSLLEKFYTSKQFEEYLDKTYDLVLFKENTLRLQYFKIKSVFEDEWNMLSAKHRKAVGIRALSNLREQIDEVRFDEIAGVGDMLRGLGLKTSSSIMTGQKHYLRWRAAHCFELDPSALGSSPFWLFNIIGWILGGDTPLQQQFSPAPHEARRMNLRGGQCNFWCLGYCSQCGSASDSDGAASNVSSSNATITPCQSWEKSPEPAASPSSTSSPTGSDQPPLPAPVRAHDPLGQASVELLTAPRLMSNALLDPIFQLHTRTPEWLASHPGAANFIECTSLDTALFYCHYIEQIVTICGQIRREKVWFRLPTLDDHLTGKPCSVTSTYRRGRRTSVLPASQGNARFRSSHPSRCPDDVATRRRREAVEATVQEEIRRVKRFVEETQRTADHLVLGITLVDNDTGTPVAPAADGGLWGVPFSDEERRRVKEISEMVRAQRENC